MTVPLRVHCISFSLPTAIRFIARSVTLHVCNMTILLGQL